MISRLLNSLDYILPLYVNLPYDGKALNSLICADVPLSNCSLTHSLSLLCRCCWRRRIRTTSAYTRSVVAFCGMIIIFSWTSTRSPASQSKPSFAWHMFSFYQMRSLCEIGLLSYTVVNVVHVIYVNYLSCCFLRWMEWNAVFDVHSASSRMLPMILANSCFQICLRGLWVMSLSLTYQLIYNRADSWLFCCKPQPVEQLTHDTQCCSLASILMTLVCHLST